MSNSLQFQFIDRQTEKRREVNNPPTGKSEQMLLFNNRVVEQKFKVKWPMSVASFTNMALLIYFILIYLGANEPSEMSSLTDFIRHQAQD